MAGKFYFYAVTTETGKAVPVLAGKVEVMTLQEFKNDYHNLIVDDTRTGLWALNHVQVEIKFRAKDTIRIGLPLCTLMYDTTEESIIEKLRAKYVALCLRMKNTKIGM